jgi:hypothetical protein
MEVRNDWEFRVYGMKRSGHHAIIMWLASHFPLLSVFFINDVLPFEDPFLSHINSADTTTRSPHFVIRGEDDIARERRSHKQCLMYNYEEPDFTRFNNYHAVPNKLETVGASAKEFSVLVLRDPFNIAASRWKFVLDGHKRWFKATLDRWAVFAREFAGDTNYLGPKLLINYNRWFTSEDYRREISRSLGLAFTDAGLNTMAANGAGSSWDGLRFDKNAQRMKVLDRWREVLHVKAFRQLFLQRDDIWDLSYRIFGYLPGTEILLNELPERAGRFRSQIRTPPSKPRPIIR